MRWWKILGGRPLAGTTEGKMRFQKNVINKFEGSEVKYSEFVLRNFSKCEQ